MLPYLILIMIFSVDEILGLNKSYCFDKIPVSFQAALKTCDLINGTVVSIDSLEEENFIKANYLYSVSGIWLAIYDISGTENNVNYYTNLTLNYVHWYTGEPSNLKDYCVRLDFSKQSMADMTCSVSYSVLCEISKFNSESTKNTSTRTERCTTDTTTSTTTTDSTTSTNTTEISTSTTTTVTTISTTTTDTTTSTNTTEISTSTTTTVTTTLTTTTDTTMAITTTETTTLSKTSQLFNNNSISNPFWNPWSAWSFCQLLRKRNNSKFFDGIEMDYQNVSCSLVCNICFI